MKIADIVGARPQFIKLAPVLRAIGLHNEDYLEQQIEEILIHTGQHYDYEMSQVFFKELGLKIPDYNLGIGSGTHGYQTGEMLKAVEDVLLKEKPDMVMVYGDTNSTLAGALAAVKLHIPVAHVEAGLRSFNRVMPEEHNRVLTDHCSDLLFCPTESAIDNLKREGFVNILNDGQLSPIDYNKAIELSKLQPNHPRPLVVNIGDVMYDAVLLYSQFAENESNILKNLDLAYQAYALATLHRAENTDNDERLINIFQALEEICSCGLPVVLPIHPRTREALTATGIRVESIKLIDPVSYLDMLILENNARVILTDSGGVQKEAYFSKVPCVTLREETEWVETVDTGWNVLAGSNTQRIVQSALGEQQGQQGEQPYGDSLAAERIISLVSAG